MTVTEDGAPTSASPSADRAAPPPGPGGACRASATRDDTARAPHAASWLPAPVPRAAGLALSRPYRLGGCTHVWGAESLCCECSLVIAGLRRQPLLPRSWSIFAGTSASERTWSGAGSGRAWVRMGFGYRFEPGYRLDG